VAEVGTSKSRGGGDKGCTISLIGCGASGAYAPGPDDKEEELNPLVSYPNISLQPTTQLWVASVTVD